MTATSDTFSPLRWTENGSLELINQLDLPGEEHWKTCNHEEDVAKAAYEKAEAIYRKILDESL